MRPEWLLKTEKQINYLKFLETFSGSVGVPVFVDSSGNTLEYLHIGFTLPLVWTDGLYMAWSVQGSAAVSCLVLSIRLCLQQCWRTPWIYQPQFPWLRWFLPLSTRVDELCGRRTKPLMNKFWCSEHLTNPLLPTKRKNMTVTMVIPLSPPWLIHFRRKTATECSTSSHFFIKF